MQCSRTGSPAGHSHDTGQACHPATVCLREGGTEGGTEGGSE